MATLTRRSLDADPCERKLTDALHAISRVTILLQTSTDRRLDFQDGGRGGWFSFFGSEEQIKALKFCYQLRGPEPDKSLLNNIPKQLKGLEKGDSDMGSLFQLIVYVFITIFPFAQRPSTKVDYAERELWYNALDAVE